MSVGSCEGGCAVPHAWYSHIHAVPMHAWYSQIMVPPCMLGTPPTAAPPVIMSIIGPRQTHDYREPILPTYITSQCRVNRIRKSKLNQTQHFLMLIRFPIIRNYVHILGILSRPPPARSEPTPHQQSKPFSARSPHIFRSLYHSHRSFAFSSWPSTAFKAKFGQTRRPLKVWRGSYGIVQAVIAGQGEPHTATTPLYLYGFSLCCLAYSRVHLSRKRSLTRRTTVSIKNHILLF